MNNKKLWPELPFEDCKDTMETLHMKMQIAGKVKLALTPYLNQWWNVAFYLNTSGMTTGPLPYKNIVFEINFDFLKHILTIRVDDNRVKEISLLRGSVSDFYREFMHLLNELGISVVIDTLPSEVPNPIRCDADERSTYETDHILRWWQILLHSKIIFGKFRTSFGGKSSPVHFFWGSFDLSHTRYNGKPATPPEHGGRIMQFAENEENFACGFWHGNLNYPKPAFYSYFYPAPKGIENALIKPGIASYNASQGLFILDYDNIRTSGSAEDLILEFLNSTYEKGAALAMWDTDSLKTPVPD
jgi:hypothetical protein